MTRREMLERIAHAAHCRAKITGIPTWLVRANATVLGALHPRMGQFLRFVVDLARYDLIAPTLGTTRLADYVDSLGAVGRRTAG
jgi:hypothetical protein